MATVEAKARGCEGGAGPDFSELPEGCIAAIVSLTTPRDACRLSLVASVFRSACGSDAVWSAFLPPDYKSVVASASPSPRRFSSLKDLYFSLCNDPLLVGDGKMSFSLDRHSGKKCIMLSARTLSIVWGDTPRYWSWTPSSDSRFADVAELINVCWFEIRGKISSSLLSPETHYAAYLVFKSTPSVHGFDVQSVEVGAGFVGDEEGNQDRCVYLCGLTSLNNARRQHVRFRRAGFYPIFPVRFGQALALEADDDDVPMVQPRGEDRDGDFPKERLDGWLEIELGEFFVKGGDSEEVQMSVLETKAGNWKGGLIIEGIEIRPKERREGK